MVNCTLLREFIIFLISHFQTKMSSKVNMMRFLVLLNSKIKIKKKKLSKIHNAQTTTKFFEYWEQTYCIILDNPGFNYSLFTRWIKTWLAYANLCLSQFLNLYLSIFQNMWIFVDFKIYRNSNNRRRINRNKKWE